MRCCCCDVEALFLLKQVPLCSLAFDRLPSDLLQLLFSVSDRLCSKLVANQILVCCSFQSVCFLLFTDPVSLIFFGFGMLENDFGGCLYNPRALNCYYFGTVWMDDEACCGVEACCDDEFVLNNQWIEAGCWWIVVESKEGLVNCWWKVCWNLVYDLFMNKLILNSVDIFVIWTSVMRFKRNWWFAFCVIFKGKRDWCWIDILEGFMRLMTLL